MGECLSKICPCLKKKDDNEQEINDKLKYLKLENNFY